MRWTKTPARLTTYAVLALLSEIEGEEEQNQKRDIYQNWQEGSVATGVKQRVPVEVWELIEQVYFSARFTTPSNQIEQKFANACALGQLEFAQCYHTHHIIDGRMDDDYPLRAAVANGHLDVVRWLVEGPVAASLLSYKTEGYNSLVISLVGYHTFKDSVAEWAANREDMVKFILQHISYEPCARDLADCWRHELPDWESSFRITQLLVGAGAAYGGDRWLSKVMLLGHSEVAKWIINKWKVDITSKAFMNEIIFVSSHMWTTLDIKPETAAITLLHYGVPLVHLFTFFLLESRNFAIHGTNNLFDFWWDLVDQFASPTDPRVQYFMDALFVNVADNRNKKLFIHILSTTKNVLSPPWDLCLYAAASVYGRNPEQDIFLYLLEEFDLPVSQKVFNRAMECKSYGILCKFVEKYGHLATKSSVDVAVSTRNEACWKLGRYAYYILEGRRGGEYLTYMENYEELVENIVNRQDLLEKLESISGHRGSGPPHVQSKSRLAASSRVGIEDDAAWTFIGFQKAYESKNKPIPEDYIMPAKGCIIS